MKTVNKIKIYEDRRLTGELQSYFVAVADILNRVKDDYEQLEIGTFDDKMVQEFIRTGPAAVVEQYRATFEQEARDLPKIVRASLVPKLNEDTAAKFKNYHDEILKLIGQIKGLASTLNMKDQGLLTATANRFELLKINSDGKVQLTPEGYEVTVSAFTFWASTPTQLKIHELGGKAEKILTEIMTLVKAAGYTDDLVYSFPNDRNYGLIEFDLGGTVQFKPEMLRFLD
jgi:hypothetical protein